MVWRLIESTIYSSLSMLGWVYAKIWFLSLHVCIVLFLSKPMVMVINLLFVVHSATGRLREIQYTCDEIGTIFLHKRGQ